ncbi:PREDICTED: carbohydrate sulfotransferase 1-like [Priapulus caudatus]|uniref:Carbohydrate sulfotransferase 1-like n=1 Tax=Priapulus caudatus TaxID=37621 RepID=A0ABM1EG93_PRICU|nr:PREDICTED: carbohydrate sulfotransferase 1-like [Priapulus caudatus]
MEVEETRRGTSGSICRYGECPAGVNGTLFVPAAPISLLGNVRRKFNNVFGKSTMYPTVRAKNVRNVVIILAYYRSGSSYTGSVFNTHKDVMYLFEPLYNVQKGYSNAKANSVSAKLRRILQRIVDCKLDDYVDDFRINPSFLKRSRAVTHAENCSYVLHARKVFKCASFPSALTRYDRRAAASRTSQQRRKLPAGLKSISLGELCRRYDTLVLKLIRGDIAEIEPLLGQRGKRIRVIHLVRDPRGMLRSQKSILGPRFGLHESVNVSMLEQAHELCDRMLRNLVAADRLNSRRGDVVMTVRYEDMATDPHGVVDGMFKFADIAMSSDVRRLLMMTAAKARMSREDAYGTVRKNSTKTAYAWEKEDASFLRPIEYACGEFLSKAGYPVTSSLSATEQSPRER